MSRLQTPIRRNDTVLVTAGKDRGKRGRVLKVHPDKNRAPRRGRELHQPPHPAEPGQEHQGRHHEARGAAARLQRAAGVPRVRRADPHRPQDRSRTGARSASAASAREWSTNEPGEGTLPPGRRAGPDEGVRLHERHGRPQDHEGRGQHGARRSHAEREDRRHRPGRTRADRRAEAPSSRAPGSRSPSSSCARACPSAPW